MVPQSLDSNFDFHKQPITTKITNGKLSAANGTTLGADNGIGVAAAVVALLDDELQDCNLAAIFTLEEETGLNGANALSPKFLENADYLLNLDSEDWGELFIGCAGGVRTDSQIELHKEYNNQKFSYRITLKNLKGGHSGCDIHLLRANAIIENLKFANTCELSIANIYGGTLDNAIPRECVIEGSSNLELSKLKELANQFAKDFTQKFTDDNELILQIEKLDKNFEFVFQDSKVLINNLATLPNGAIKFAENMQIVETSSNFAVIKTENDKIFIKSSQRSLFNKKRDALQNEISSHLSKIGGKSQAKSPYPAWEMQDNLELVDKAKTLFKTLFDKEPEVKVMHAGLECGIFYGKNPKLEMLSFGPTIKYPHSPSEYLEIDTVADFYQYLQQLIKKVNF
jgi:dipeptidase D